MEISLTNLEVTQNVHLSATLNIQVLQVLLMLDLG